MDDKTRDLLGMYFDPEMGGLEDDVVESLRNMPSDYRSRAKSGWADVLRTRSMSLLEFYDLTHTDLDYRTEDQLYADIAKAYEHLFGEPAPTYQQS